MNNTNSSIFIIFSILILSLILTNSCNLKQTNNLTQDSGTQSCNCSTPSVSGGLDFSGQTLLDHNFTTYAEGALINANFEGAILKGSQFQNKDLSGANFRNAVLSPSTIRETNFSGSRLTGTCFVGAIADSMNLISAKMKGTDFSCSSLINTIFGLKLYIEPSSNRTLFRNTTLSVPNFPLSSFHRDSSFWGLTDFTNSQFAGLKKEDLNFVGWNMENAILNRVNLSGFDFSHANLNGANFTHAVLSGSQMDHAKMIGVRMDTTNLSEASLKYAIFYDSINQQNISKLNLANLNNTDLSHAYMRKVEFRGANFAHAVLQNTNLTEAVFSQGNNYGAAQMEHMKASGANFKDASLNGVSFINSYLDQTNFRAVLSNNDFTDCILSGADFSAGESESLRILESIIFRNAILHNVNFKRTRITGSENGFPTIFSCSQLGGAEFTNSEFGQVTFSNAVVLADPKLCCIQSDNSYFCGRDNKTSKVYGLTILPDLKGSTFPCPNGDVASCSGNQWILPNWTTSDCGQSGEVMWVAPPEDCNLTRQDTIVHFKDQNLQKCICDNYFQGDTSKSLLAADAQSIFSLSCPNYGIVDLDGLENLTNLEFIDFTNNQITNSEIWQHFKHLTTLEIAENQLKQITLTNLTNLFELRAPGNQIEAIINMPSNIQILDLSYNALQTFPLSDLPVIYIANLSHNILNDVGDVSECTYISNLYLENNALTTIGSMASLAYLNSVDLSCNYDLDCTSLGISPTTFESYHCGNNSTGCN